MRAKVHRMITVHARPRQTDVQTDRLTEEHHGNSALKVNNVTKCDTLQHM